MERREELINEADAAKILNLSPNTLRGDRQTNRLGIPWIKTAGQVGKRGGRVAYSPSALGEWIERRTVRA